MRVIISTFLIAQFIFPISAHLGKNRTTINLILRQPSLLKPLVQSSNLTILGPQKEKNLVVNEDGNLGLTVIDADGKVVTDVTFESGSPDIAAINSQTGMMTGRQRGFATITARRGNESVSTFVGVA